MNLSTHNEIPCTSKVEINQAKYIVELPSASKSDAPAHIITFPKYTDPLFRQIDARSMINASTTCSLETLKGDVQHEGRKSSIAQSMIHHIKTPLQNKISSTSDQSEIANIPYKMHHTFRRGDQSYNSELNEHTCSWEDLEGAGVIFDAKYDLLRKHEISMLPLLFFLFDLRPVSLSSRFRAMGVLDRYAGELLVELRLLWAWNTGPNGPAPAPAASAHQPAGQAADAPAPRPSVTGSASGTASVAGSQARRESAQEAAPAATAAAPTRAYRSDLDAERIGWAELERSGVLEEAR